MLIRAIRASDNSPIPLQQPNHTLSTANFIHPSTPSHGLRLVIRSTTATTLATHLYGRFFPLSHHLHYNAFTTTNGGHLAWASLWTLLIILEPGSSGCFLACNSTAALECTPAPTPCSPDSVPFRFPLYKLVIHWQLDGRTGLLWDLVVSFDWSLLLFCRLHSTKKHDTNLSSFYERGKGLPRLRWLAFVSVPCDSVAWPLCLGRGRSFRTKIGGGWLDREGERRPWPKVRGWILRGNVQGGMPFVYIVVAI